MSIVQRILSIIFVSWGFLTFISAMLLVLPFILLCFALLRGKTANDAVFSLLNIWGSIFCILCFFRVRTKNKSLLEPGKAYIYVCNHASYLDAVAIVLAIPGSFKALGKIEMARIPVFGLIYRRVVVMIDRANKESRARSVERLKADLESGQSIFIFPEGTMNKTDKPLTDFYDGAFRLAIETQTAIAPLVIINARHLFPRADPFSARPGVITCIFDTPVETAGLVADELETLKAKVYDRMETLSRTAS